MQLVYRHSLVDSMFFFVIVSIVDGVVTAAVTWLEKSKSYLLWSSLFVSQKWN